jgi:hypothetical protein
MQLPITTKLLEGVKFDFPTLANNYECTEQFRSDWWERAPKDVISRPETIEDNDPILTETFGKATVDLRAYRERFNGFLTGAIEQGRLPAAMAFADTPFGRP